MDSCTFPQQQSHPQTRLTVMIGGDPSTHDAVVDVVNTDAETLKNIALQSVKYGGKRRHMQSLSPLSPYTCSRVTF